MQPQYYPQWYVTAADSRYFRLALGLVQSLVQMTPLSPGRMIIFNCGLRDYEVKELESYGVNVFEAPDLSEYYGDLGVRIPPAHWGYVGRALINKFILEKCKEFSPSTYGRAATEEDVIVWLDSDVWIQDRSGIHAYVLGALQDDVAAMPEVGKYLCFNDEHGRMLTTWAVEMYFKFFGEDAARSLGILPMLNNGIFAAKINSPLWENWYQSTRIALMTRGSEDFGIDQTAFNYAIYMQKLKLCPMDFLHNWQVAYCQPVLKEGKLVEPKSPYQEITLVHLLGNSKWSRVPIKELDEMGNTIGGDAIFVDFLEMQHKLEKQKWRSLPETNEKVA